MDTINSFHKKFCSFLEYHLCETFRNSGDKMLRFFWCDGIDHTSASNIKEQVATSKQIITRAWMGQDGQDVYTMTVKLGERSLRAYMQDIDLEDYVPSGKSTDWLSVDPEQCTIEIRLV